MNMLRKRELVMALAEGARRRHLRMIAAAPYLYNALKGAVEYINDPKVKVLAKQALKRVDL